MAHEKSESENKENTLERFAVFLYFCLGSIGHGRADFVFLLIWFRQNWSS
jgi:hypothetical protein